MKDRYLDTDQATYRLVRDYYKHGNIIIAVDFDNTLFDFMYKGYSESVLDLIRHLSKNKKCQFTFILFTAREEDKLKEAEEYCAKGGIRIDHVNESPVMSHTRKPFYNILLDDKAGLGQAYEILVNFLNIIDYDN